MGEGCWSDFIILFMAYFFLFIYFFIILFIPLTCIRYIYKNFSQATVNSEIHANVSVKRHICDVKICD